ncbi:hypothetical protein V8G54_027653 [Vigna mungo]|uniref:Uncharacterized protein n=1 Tax=Vigna mungo TaxID=3915 RepID=A0AAQ3RN96_VIGMU
MTSSSSRRGKKAAQVVRNASPNGWISDDETRYKFGCYRKLFEVVPHKYLDLELFKKQGFLFQDWLVEVGLAKFVEMTGDCYPDLVEVFYHNLKDVDETLPTFTPRTEFERFVGDQFQRLLTRISNVENSLIMIHNKLNEDTTLLGPLSLVRLICGCWKIFMTWHQRQKIDWGIGRDSPMNRDLYVRFIFKNVTAQYYAAISGPFLSIVYPLSLWGDEIVYREEFSRQENDLRTFEIVLAFLNPISKQLNKLSSHRDEFFYVPFTYSESLVPVSNLLHNQQ